MGWRTREESDLFRPSLYLEKAPVSGRAESFFRNGCEKSADREAGGCYKGNDAMEMDDHLLLRRFSQMRCEAAFAELVRRHLDFVYGAALRQVHGDHTLAREVSQVVFSDLARKASGFDSSSLVMGWLYKATRFAAAKAVRTEVRRRRREAAALAMTMGERDSDSQEVVWEDLRPVIDDALSRLNAPEREVLILRFLEPRSIAEVAATLGIGESAARMRVERALERLRVQLARRKIVSTASALSVALGASQVVVAAPSALAGAVVATGVAAIGTTTTGVSLLSFMTLSKLQWGVAAISLVGGSAWYAVQENERRDLTAQIATFSEQRALMATQQADLGTLRQTLSEQEALRVQASQLGALKAKLSELWKRYEAKSLQGYSKSRDTKTQPSPHAEGPVLGSKDVDSMPRIVRQGAPKYPNDMRVAGIPGEALVSLVVSTDGRVTDVQVESATSESFGLAAVDAVEQWTFKPGMKSGLPVNTRLKVPIVFSVVNDSKEWF